MHLVDTLRVVKRSKRGRFELSSKGGAMAATWAPFASILYKALVPGSPGSPHSSIKHAASAVLQLWNELGTLKKADFPPGYAEESYRLQWIIRCLVLVRLCHCE